MAFDANASPGRSKQSNYNTRSACAEEEEAPDAAEGARELIERLQHGAAEIVAAAGAAELCELNAKHAVLRNEGGKCVVLSRVRDPVGGAARERVQFQSFNDFRNRYLNRRVCAGYKDGHPQYKKLGAWWLEHPERREYEALTFEPGGPNEIEGYLNLWRGWGVTPMRGDWSLLRAHMREVLANGDEQAFAYMLNWCAFTLQNSSLPAEVALIFKGGRGTGKGMFGRAMVRLFGQHGLQISGSGHLTGRFNAHLRDLCLLFADEALAKGDVEAEAKLKALITEPTLIIEGKGRDAIEAPNRLHIIMASNRDWVVPAGADERRFAVFDVSEQRKGDAAYFKALVSEMESGGLAAMLFDMLAVELGDWHPRHDVPQTHALRDQKEHSLPPEEQWVLGLLDAAELPGRSPPNPRRATCNDLYEAARKASPKLRDTSDNALARHLTDKWNLPKKDVRVGGHRAREFPPLQEMRRQFEAKYGQREWASDADEWL